ncbi:hypothetical protein B0A55_08657 [Friedmanniomyces simplex]|uniref:Heterokaryon incompatibility domain-containing protein n=1 Tax=Friedmanniomyces simplex TaxID=329884 RepID=A0A4U0X7V2_9PEZI|nr:hypothetical protein B0A55_08657 [Friedmanniomyces simplex]
MPALYTYRRLNPQQQEIRLLRILPDKCDEPIRVIVEHASVAKGQRPPYETISYVWGDSTRSARLTIQESPVTLGKHHLYVPASTEAALDRIGWSNRPWTRHLYVPASTQAVLKRVRLAHRPRIVWIDAVCINQDDLAERGQQVAIMGEIYAGSVRNLVYLGELQDQNMADRIVRTIDNLMDDAECKTEGLQTFRSTVRDDRLGAAKFVFGGLQCEVDLEAVQFVLELRWFRRLWTLQEAALAPYNLALLGTLQYDLLIIFRAMVWWARYNPNFSTQLSPEAAAGFECLGRAHNFTDHQQGALAGRSASLQALLVGGWVFEKSEARDGVFAVLAMAERLPAALMPDYTKPLSDILQAATRYALEARSNLELLRNHSIRPGDLEDAAVASWAVRFDRQYDTAIDSTRFPELRKASAGLDKRSRLAAGPLEEGVLQLEGCLVDEVVGTTSECSGIVYWSKRAFLAWIREAIILYRSGTGPRTHPPTGGAFARTLTVGAKPFHVNERESEQDEDIVQLCNYLNWASTANPRLLDEQPELHQPVGFYWGCTVNRRFFVTRSGLPGLGPQVVQSGDVVVVLRDADVPYTLRPLESGQYQLVGAAYVEGIMDGEAVEECKARGDAEVVFDLV